MTILQPTPYLRWDFPTPNFQIYLQAPLPGCLDILPKLVSIEGQGTEGQDSVPLAPPEEPKNA